MKILVVDDSKAMRMIVKRTLSKAGIGEHTTVEAENGQEGLDMVASEKPDMVLCDWNMPVMSGIEFLRALRAQGNSVKFGFVTSEGSEGMEDAAAAAGASFVITKPFTPDTFKDRLVPLLAA